MAVLVRDTVQAGALPRDSISGLGHHASRVTCYVLCALFSPSHCRNHFAAPGSKAGRARRMRCKIAPVGLRSGGDSQDPGLGGFAIVAAYAFDRGRPSHAECKSATMAGMVQQLGNRQGLRSRRTNGRVRHRGRQLLPTRWPEGPPEETGRTGLIAENSVPSTASGQFGLRKDCRKLLASTCESGGIGRRTRLRIWRVKPWGFESPLSHQSHLLFSRCLVALRLFLA